MRFRGLFLLVLLAAPALSGCLASTVEYSGESARVSEDWAHDGSGVRNAQGTFTVRVSDRTNTGRVEAQVTDGTDRWRVEWTRFAGRVEAHDGGIVRDLTEHGATGIGGTVIPQVTLPLAGWGEAVAYRNGNVLRDRTTGDDTLLAHFMIVDGALRDDRGRIWNADRTAPYDPANPADGSVGEGGPHFFLQLQNRDGSYVKVFEFRTVRAG